MTDNQHTDGTKLENAYAEKHGWVIKKFGKNRWMACWLEGYVSSTLAVCYTDNPLLGHVRATFYDMINVNGARFKTEENPKKSRFTLVVREATAKKSHFLVLNTKEERDEWHNLFLQVSYFLGSVNVGRRKNFTII
jgi:hypothetical protein